MTGAPLGWLAIARLGLVQTALGAIVVLTTSTMNRVMVVELALPAALPGALVGLHYALQVLRPRWGHASDVGGRLTRWIVCGMAVLASGGTMAAAATAWMATAPLAGAVLAVLAFLLIGAGVGAAGTSLLVLLAKLVGEKRRPAAATLVWVMMIAGFIVTATVAGHFLDPFSPARLVAVTAAVSGAAFLVTLLAVWGVEPRGAAGPAEPSKVPQPPVAFRAALAQVWSEPKARRFTVFVFASMLAYSAQDLILEPFAGSIFGLTPGQSTKLAGLQNGGVLAGMLLVALIGSRFGSSRLGSMRTWAVLGCLASGAALLALAAAGLAGPAAPLRPIVFALGLSNGAFAVAAISSMMSLAGEGRQERAGVRMGLWGAAQAFAFGVGGLAGATAVDVAGYVLGAPAAAYGIVFTCEALLFIVAASLAADLRLRPTPRAAVASIPTDAVYARGLASK